MQTHPLRTHVVVLSLLAVVTTAAQSNSLRIVVVSGEDAVNIIQQKTATAPVVEVRDRNNLPVAGATVTFTISTNGTAAFAGGAQAMTITTNAAGQAVAAAVNPLAQGAVQIQVQAVFQGQSVAAAIAQTNVLTAAEAAASGAGAAAGGGSAAGGGGMSTTAIAGIVGGAGAAAAGAVVATTNKDEADAGPVSVRPSGAYDGGGSITFTSTFANGVIGSCTHNRTLRGTLTLDLQQARDGTISGTATTTTGVTVLSVTSGCSPENMVIGATQSVNWSLPVTGNAQSVSFTGQQPFTAVPFNGGSVTGVRTLSFQGSMAGGVVTGTLQLDETADGTTLNAPLTWRGAASATVTLR